MKSFGARLSLAVLLMGAISAAASAQSPIARGTSVKKPGGPPPSSPTATLLYDQTDNASGQFLSSQDFETSLDAFDTEAADDFVVPNGVFWSITQVFISGRYSAAGPAAAVNVNFYADAAGLPGSIVCGYPLQIPADATGSFTVTLPTPCVLGPGTHWMSAQARQDFTPAGQWYWDLRTTQSGAAGVWRNPGDGFATGCTAFAPVGTCLPGTSPDFLFSLSGTPGGVIPPAPAECGSTTSYFENATPVAILDLDTVTSTIDVTGAGASLWDLNLVTFIRHTFADDLDVTITSPSGTVVTLTTDNGGSSDDVFNGTVWDDQANPGGQVPYTSNNGLVTDNLYSNGVLASPLAPEEALGAFRGENPNGTWTLTISDDEAADVGTLDKWSVQVTTLDSAPTIQLQNSFVNSVATPIADDDETTSTVPVFGLGKRICSMTAYTDITHTDNSDIDMTLMSPAGTVVTLTSDNAPYVDVFHGTTWDDKANPGGQVPYSSNNGLVTDTDYADGVVATPLVPEEALSAFLGEDPNGTWTLTVADDTAADTGTLNSWSVSITTCSCAFAEAAGLRVDEHAGSGSSSNLNGVFELGETVQVEPQWSNPGGSSYDLFGTGVGFTGAGSVIYTMVDNAASYGTLAPAASGNCFDSTANCYGLQVTGVRPTQHWDASFTEFAAPYAAPAGSSVYNKDWILHIGESFPDVLTSNLFYPFVENIFHNGVTGGCAAAPNYCPTDFTLRKQMAVFVLKSKEGKAYIPPPAVGVFTDVPQADPFAPWIEELYNRGVVAGCGAGPAYCPDNPVLRQQMAIFLLKTLLGSSYTPPDAVGLFPDVPVSNPFAPWIEDLFNRSIAAGCGGGNFCPTNSTTRGQMAPFLVKTFTLLLYGL